MKRTFIYFVAAALSVWFVVPASCQEHEFNTKYTKIHYSQEKDINDFIWKIGGQKIEFSEDSGLASNRVDRIIEKVETILDMYPKNFRVNIYLYRGPIEPNKAAFYDYKTKSIHISVEYATDGVLAHEAAHAVINQHFNPPPPSKVQEILTQYVDKYLWSDY